jgi:uncharacterized membrane protein YeaQ/YmgE (transglycosylase-associated protein family)
MEMLTSVLIGGLVGGVACFILWSRQIGTWPTLTVGILGALLGLATHTGLGSKFPGCEYFASSVGALLSLLLWCVAQRLFLATPSEKALD